MRYIPKPNSYLVWVYLISILYLHDVNLTHANTSIYKQELYWKIQMGTKFIKLKKILTILQIVLLQNISNGQAYIANAVSLYNNGYYHKSIEMLLNHQTKLARQEKPKYYQLLADNCIKVGDTEKFKIYSDSSFISIQNKTTLDSALYFSNLSEYNHFLLRVDSSTFYAKLSLKYLERNFPKEDSSLIARIYFVYGNSMRNGVFNYPEINKWEIGDSIVLKRKHSIKYLEKSLRYANKYQKIEIYKRLGTVYNDLMSINQDDYGYLGELIGLKDVFVKCCNYYTRAIKLARKTIDNSSSFISNCYALLGLTYQYNKDYTIANFYYDKAIAYSQEKGAIKSLNNYNIAISWKGWNYEVWYNKSKNIEHLKKSLETYENGVKSWANFCSKYSDKQKGMDDAYRISVTQKIPNSCFDLYQLTKSMKYIDKAIFYGDMDRYATATSHLKIQDSLSIKTIQGLIQNDETLVFFISSNNPNKTHAIIVNKKSCDFILLNKSRIRINEEKYGVLNSFKTVDSFKEISFGYYQLLFKPLDSIFTKNKAVNVVIVPSPEFSLLNFDLLISDTTHQKWQDQPYMFHKYNFSYALSLGILTNNYSANSNKNDRIGILKGSFNELTNLRFSNKFINQIQAKYNTKVINSISVLNFEEEVNKNGIFILLGHGKGGYRSTSSTIHITDSLLINSTQLMEMNLSSNLFITTACKTNQSFTYMSEGSTGGFEKALLYTGIKSCLTTSWEIDDKANAIIMGSFLSHLVVGRSKSKALWFAKKEYWDNCQQDVEFKPFYWAGYRLTGNTKAIRIAAKKTNNFVWLWLLLIIPIGYLGWKKFS